MQQEHPTGATGSDGMRTHGNPDYCLRYSAIWHSKPFGAETLTNTSMGRGSGGIRHPQGLHTSEIPNNQANVWRAM